MDNFRDAKVLVTGAASGIGAAIATAFLDAGANVIGIDRAQGVGQHVTVLHADLADEQTVINAVADAASRMGKIDVLVNCAGVDGENPLATFDIRDFDRVFSVNVRGAILVAREALRHMTAGGRIVNIASELAFIGREGAGCYCASKGAILSLTRAWSRELAPGITVNAVAPGATQTPMLKWDSISDEIRQKEIDNPIGRVAQPSEIARAVLFLAGAESSFITGQCVSIDGGAAMH